MVSYVRFVDLVLVNTHKALLNDGHHVVKTVAVVQKRTRQLNEQLATPPWADKTKFSTAMADANAMGLDGDHIREISRTAEGIRWLESTGRGTAKQMFDSYEKAGLPLGNQAGNVQPLNPKINQHVNLLSYVLWMKVLHVLDNNQIEFLVN